MRCRGLRRPPPQASAAPVTGDLGMDNNDDNVACQCLFLKREKRVDMSMMLMWYASIIVGYDKKKIESRLSEAPLRITQDTSGTEK